MIFDKVGEFVYEQASRFFTRWRVCCFLVTCFILSDVIFNIFTIEFWKFSLSEGGAVLVSGVLGLPMYMIALIAFLSFIFAPLVSKKLSLLILRVEYKRAEKAISEIESKVALISRDSIIYYRDNAIKGEGHIQDLGGLNEVLVYSCMLGAFMQWQSDVSYFYYSFVFVTPALIYFSVQQLFATYLKSVFFYKKLSEYISSVK